MESTLDAPRLRRMPLPARGGEMAYLDLGPPDRPVDVVFSHANGFNGLTYRSILAPLAGELRILVVDARGHGASTLPADGEGWSGWMGFRDDLIAFLDAVASGPVVLSGHSMGGTTGLLVAAAEPQRVKALALFDPVIFEGSNRQRQDPSPLEDGAMRRRADFANRAEVLAAYSGRGAFRSWRPEQLADYVEGGFREADGGGVTLACAPAWEASNFRMHNYDAFAAFRASRCRIRILKAENASTARFGEHETELLATGRIAIREVPGTTHFLPMERPDLVVETLRAVAAL